MAVSCARIITQHLRYGHAGLGQCGKTGARGPQYQLDFVDKVSHTFGNHSIKFGFEPVFVHFDDSSLSNTNGTVTFLDPGKFSDFAPVFSSEAGSILTGDNYDNYRENWYGAFVEDTWRVTRRVTVTPGLRWEYVGSPHSTVNHLGTFDPNQPGGAVQVGPGLPNSTVIHPEKTNFQPRFGVAWDVIGHGKTVVRGGFGMMSSLRTYWQCTGAQVPYGATMCNGPTITPAGAPLGATGCAAGNIAVNRFGTPINSVFSSTLSFLRPRSMPNWTTTCTNPMRLQHAADRPSSRCPRRLSATSGPECTTSAQCSFYGSESELEASKVYSVESGHRARHHESSDDGHSLRRRSWLRRSSLVDLNEAAINWAGHSTSLFSTASVSVQPRPTGIARNKARRPRHQPLPAHHIAKLDTTARRILPRSLPRGPTAPSSLISSISLKRQMGSVPTMTDCPFSLNARNYHGANLSCLLYP